MISVSFNKLLKNSFLGIVLLSGSFAKGEIQSLQELCAAMRDTPYSTAIGAAHYWFDPLAGVVLGDLHGHFVIDGEPRVTRNRRTKHVVVSIVPTKDEVHEYLHLDADKENSDYDDSVLKMGWFGPDQIRAREIRNAIPKFVKSLDDATRVLECLQELSRGEHWFINADGDFHIGEDPEATFYGFLM